MDNPNLIFLISLPRSGSTLLQKMLTTSPYIYSTSEPWLMLPQLFILQKEGLRTTYGHETFMYAIEDFIRQLPNGYQDYYDSLQEFAISLYGKVEHDAHAQYFLDKTPRYYLIMQSLLKIFPNAKFILLFRNPLEVFASILRTWFENRFFIYKNSIDIFQGPHLLAAGLELLKDRCIAVQYGDLIDAPDEELNRICTYLNISYTDSMVDQYSNVEFRGIMGDPEKARAYATISKEPILKWKKTFNTHYRKWFAKLYVRRLGDETLSAFNTSINDLLADIDSIKELEPGSIRDAWDHMNCLMKILFDNENLSQRFRKLRQRKQPFPYR